jgi:decaprenyl-phosphate phosphoribosyltransferase
MTQPQRASGVARVGGAAAAVLRSCRPQQWVKNVLVLAAPVAAGRLGERDVWWPMLGAFVAFCAAASAIYLVNDVRDREADRRHPTKQHRPVAAGLLAPGHAVVIASALSVGALVLAVVIEPALALVVASYVLLTVVYSLGLKQIPGLDLLAVAAGFVLRALAGGVATGTDLSPWFLAVTSTGSLFVVVGKRLGELVRSGSAGRPMLAAYTRHGLERLSLACAAATVVGYLMWAGNGEVVPAGAALASGVPFAGALGRYVWVVDQGRGEDPEEVLLGDRPFQVLVAIWAVVYGIGVYA